MSTLTLYHFEGCPFCVKVRRFIEEHDLSIPEKDIMIDPSARNELLSIGGKTQVPCLIIDGKALYESNDIIEWIEKNELK